MRGLRVVFVSGLVALSAAAGVNAQGQRLYKWVDEHGNVHFSDRAEATTGDVERLNANGIRVDQAHSMAPKSAEERRIAQLDTMLLATYGNELDLLRAHDAVRANMESGIRVAEANINRLRRTLQEREAHQGANAPGQPRPDAVADELRSQIRAEEARLQELRARQYELHEEQNREVARYRELHTASG